MIVRVDETNNDELYGPRLQTVSEKLLSVFDLNNDDDDNLEQKKKVFGADQTKWPERSQLIFNTIQGYYSNIEYIMELGGRYLYMPLSEEPFKIDLDTRIITTPNHFKKNGVAVVGDNKAEILYFIVDRYYDIIDLYSTSIGIKWTLIPDDKTKEVQEGISQAFCPDPTLSLDLNLGADKIIFGWVIHKELTKYAGKLKFSIIFINKNASLTNATAADYTLNTLESTAVINNTLQLNNSNIEIDASNGADIFKSFLKNTSYDGDTVSVIAPIFEIVPEQLVNLGANNKYNAEAVAYSSSLGSEVVYEWKQLDSTSTLPKEKKYIELTENEYQNINIYENKYFVKNDDSYEKATMEQRARAKETPRTEESLKLYWEASTTEISSVGNYSVEAQAITDSKYRSNTISRNFKVPRAYKVTKINDLDVTDGVIDETNNKIYFDDNGQIKFKVIPSQLTGEAYELNKTNVINITSTMTDYEKTFVGTYEDSNDNTITGSLEQPLSYIIDQSNTPDGTAYQIRIKHNKNNTNDLSDVLKEFQCYHYPSALDSNLFTISNSSDFNLRTTKCTLQLKEKLNYSEKLQWKCFQGAIEYESGILDNIKDASIEVEFLWDTLTSESIKFIITNSYAGNLSDELELLISQNNS